MNSTFTIRSTVAFVCRVGIWLVLASAIGMLPWYFGGIHAAAQYRMAWALTGACLLGVLHVLVVPPHQISRPRPALLAVLLVGVGVSACQLIPLRPGMLHRVSPQLSSWRGSLPPLTAASEGAMVVPAPADGHPVSVMPAETRRQLSLLWPAIVVFLLAQATLDSSSARLGALVVLAGNGTFFAWFGIVQQLADNGKLYWRIALPEGAVPFAGYVNRNNAAGYLNMTLAAAVGLLVWAFLRHRFNVVHPTPHGGSRRPPDRRVAMSEWLADLDAWSILAIAAVVCTVAGVVCSLSRGGVLAMGVAGAATFALLAKRDRRATWLVGLCVCGVLGLALTVWLGGGAEVQRRFGQLIEPGGWQHDSRIVHWRDGWRTATHFGRMGSGLGTYRYVHEPFQDHDEPRWYHHAENQYLESIVELGWVGPLLILLTIGAAILSMLRLMHRASGPETYGFAVAGIFAVVSQAVHGFFDFGLYLPANAMTLACICGAGCLAPRRSRGHSEYEEHADVSDVKRWGFACVIGIAGLGAWLAAGVLRPTAAVEAAERLVPEWLNNHADRRDQLAREVDALEQLCAVQPDDARLHSLLAKLWTAKYRHEATATLQAELAGQVERDELWALTDPTWIHGRVHQLTREGRDEELDQLRRQPQLRRWLNPALEHLVAARDVAPMRAQTHLALAELVPVLWPTTDDAPHLERAVALAPHQTDILFRAGLLHLQAGRMDAGVPLWQQCLATSRDYRDQILQAGPQLLGPVDFFERLFQGLPEPLVEVAFEHYGRREDRALRYQLADLAEIQLNRVERLPAAELWLAARIAWLRDDYALAEKQFRAALPLAANPVTVHYDLARLLLGQGKLTEAAYHATVCTKLQPGAPKYRKLLRDIRSSR